MKSTVYIFWITPVIVFGIAIWLLGIRVNLNSNSLPYGFYRVVNEMPDKHRIGATFLPEDIAEYGLKRGYLARRHLFSRKEPTSIMPVMKYIVGAEGDHVSIQDDILVINGVTYPQYPLLKYDSKGRPLKRFCPDSYTIPKDHYLLLSDHKHNSWDGRYWGPVKVTYILRPLMIFEDDGFRKVTLAERIIYFIFFILILLHLMISL